MRARLQHVPTWAVTFCTIALLALPMSAGLSISGYLALPNPVQTTLVWTSPLYSIAIVALAVWIATRLARRSAPPEAPPATQPANIWSDEPVDIATNDEFERLGTVGRMADILNTVGLGAPSSVIGLTGAWGSGKTSVVGSLVRRLREHDKRPWAVAEFSPWGYDSTEAMTLGFFSELRNALPQSAQWSRARDDLAALLRSVAPAGTLTTLIGVDSSKAIESLAHSLNATEPTSSARTRAARALQAIDQPILVVIDDVDRLLPEELPRLFTLIRFLGRLPNVHYLMAFDENVLTETLKQSRLVRDTTRAREYLEKIVQLRLEMPPIRDSQAEQAVDAQFEKLIAVHQLTLDADRLSDFSIIYHAHISVTVRTPRAIRRWFTHVQLLFPSLAGDVDFVDFAVFTWLRLRHPAVPELLQSHKAHLFPGSTWSTYIANKAAGADEKSLKERHALWRTWAQHSGIDAAQVDEVLAVLARLFPTIDQVVRESNSEPDLRPVGRRQGIGHPDYFERYFAIQVPSDELLESDFLAAMEAIATGRPEEAEVLAESLTREPHSTLPRIEEWSIARPSATAPIVEWLLGQWTGASNEGFMSPQNAIRGAILRILRSVPEQALLAALESALKEGSLLNPTVLAVNDLIRANALASDSPLVGSTIEAIRAHVDALAGPPGELARPFWQLVWAWQSIDGGSLQTWYRRRALLEPWNLVQALAGLVSSGTQVGVPDPKSFLHGLDDSTVEAFLGVEWIKNAATRLGIEEELGLYAGNPSSFSKPTDGHVEDTWANRVDTAKRSLARILAS